MGKYLEIDELAARYLDLWERQLALLQSDGDFERQLQRWLRRHELNRSPSASEETDDRR